MPGRPSSSDGSPWLLASPRRLSGAIPSHRFVRISAKTVCVRDDFAAILDGDDLIRCHVGDGLIRPDGHSTSIRLARTAVPGSKLARGSF